MASSNMRQFIKEVRQIKKDLEMTPDYDKEQRQDQETRQMHSVPIIGEKKPIQLAIIESPYAGDIKQNTLYARQCVSHSIREGEAPIASHLLYTQDGILNENDPQQRALGIKCGLAWLPFADVMAVYTDLGISKGMIAAIKAASAEGIVIDYRSIVEGE